MSATKKRISFDTRFKDVTSSTDIESVSVSVEIIVRIDSSIVAKMTDLEFNFCQNSIAGNALTIERDFLRAVQKIEKRKE